MQVVHGPLNRRERAQRAFLNEARQINGKASSWKLAVRSYGEVLIERAKRCIHRDGPLDKNEILMHLENGELLEGFSEMIAEGNSGRVSEIMRMSALRLEPEHLRRMNRNMNYIVDTAKVHQESYDKDAINFFVEDLRTLSAVSKLYSSMSVGLCKELEADSDGFANEGSERIALLAYALFARGYSHAVDCGCVADENGLGFGRMVFDRDHNAAWHMLRKRWGNITLGDVLEAVIMSNSPLKGLKTYAKQVRMHNMYALVRELDSQSIPLRMEASPFAQKPVGSPVYEIEIAAYPLDLAVREGLERIANPAIEHADGALALAAIRLVNGTFVLEEMQSDVPLLIRLNKEDASPALESAARQWPQVAYECARQFARINGIGVFYAATPYSVLRRWGELVHPLKLKAYFENLERMGGTLVLDDERELDHRRRRYYYMFRLD